MNDRFDIVVVGAGGGGAVLGLALAQRGIPVLVLERQAGAPSAVRGETIQPNGQQILDRLGILKDLSSDAVLPLQRFHFFRIGGARLCSMDYGMLPAPWNHALVAQSNAVHDLILKRLSAQPSAELWYGSEFQGLLRQDGKVSGVVVRRNGQGDPIEIVSRLVVGADGAGSRVRQGLGVSADVHRYRDGYLIALLPRPEGMREEARYYVGRGELLGLFPAPGNRVVTLYMVPAERVAAMRTDREELEAIKRRISRIDDSMTGPLGCLHTWDQVGFLPCVRVRTDRWVVDGAALIGDAAHAMNPHASQGRMQAMADAMVLADVIEDCRNTGDWSAHALTAYEGARRPQVTMLQQLADEQTRYWNAADPIRCWLRDRVFKGMDRNRRLRYQALTATAGLRSTPPLTWLDHLMAAGLLPDPRADAMPSF